jgi:hypothetical protein
MNDLNTFGDRIVELQNIKINLYPMSSQFSPSELYITPQCGTENIKIYLIIFQKLTELY